MKAVTKTNKDITPIGEAVLSDLREAWKDITTEREVVTLVDGKPGFVTRQITAPSPIRRLNHRISKADVIRFANMVKLEDKERIDAIIAAGSLEIAKAIQAFEAPKFAADKSLQPKTWEEAIRMNSPSIATLVKYKGESKAADLCYLLLYGFASKFGRRSDMTEEALRELAEEVAATYRAMTVADLKMILNQAIRTKKVFNLDFQTMLSIIDEGFNAKLEFAAGRSLQEHERIKSPRHQEQANHPVLSLVEQVAEVKLLSKVFEK